jgi:hypothetical protein
LNRFRKAVVAAEMRTNDMPMERSSFLRRDRARHAASVKVIGSRPDTIDCVLNPKGSFLFLAKSESASPEAPCGVF